MLLDASASGLFPIAPTPFHADGRIDERSVETLIAGYLAAGATGITVLGIMGEAPKLEPEESLAITRRFIAGFGKLPVIVGVSAPGFAAMRALSRLIRSHVLLPRVPLFVVLTARFRLKCAASFIFRSSTRKIWPIRIGVSPFTKQSEISKI